MNQKKRITGYAWRQRLREYAFSLLKVHDERATAYMLYRDYGLSLPKARSIVSYVQASLRRIEQ